MADLLFLSRVAPAAGERPARLGMRRGTRALDWYEQGCALESTDRSGAMRAYERALAGRPDLADAHNNLGRMFHELGDLGAAESCYRLALCAAQASERSTAAADAAPSDGSALYWFNLGVAIEDRGGHAEAIAAYEHALDAAREDAPHRVAADAHFNLARLLEADARRSGDELVMRRAVLHLVRYRDLSRSAR